MGETIYIHKDENAGIAICIRGATVVYTGLEVHTEEDGPELAEAERRCGVQFFRQGQAPEVPLYGVPALCVFAFDARGGYFATTGLPSDGEPVYYIGSDCVSRLAAASVEQFLAGRKGPLPEESAVLPRVFASREEAEKEFPILDVWTVLRQKREPRFQVHPMMSPQDREGRAQVHYAAWRETYTGLIDPRILEAHTLERCRERAAKGGMSNTFVALDREDGDKVVGFACFSHRARSFASVPDAGEVGALYVLREYQGLGIGRMLLERCLAWLPWPKVVLFVLEGNERAIGFYEHMGFRFTGHAVEEKSGGGQMTELEMVLEKEAT